MMVFDMTVELAPIFSGMVALLTISSAAIVASAVSPSVARFYSYITARRSRPTIVRPGAVVQASA